jgi:membrane protease YdiL (CAAX protease family)
VLIMACGIAVVVPAATMTTDRGRTYAFPELLVVLASLLVLWIAAVAGEEAMFRGWMQTQLEMRAPIWLSIVVPALLFGLRHLPLDLYESHAGMAGWATRLLELYGLALVMGLVRWRTGSVAPTVVLHAGLWWLVVLGLYGTRTGAVAGIIIGTGSIAVGLVQGKAE